MPDFSKVWATNSPLPAYTFSDADYLTGWDFIGSAPPTKTQFDAWFKMVDEKLNYLYGQLQNTASKLYPVGSVYISFNSTDPSTLFGGTWTRIKDRFLLASGDTYAPGTTGGSATKTLTTSNLPAHTHSCNTTGSHTHARGTFNITGRIGAIDGQGSAPTGAFYRSGSSGKLENQSGEADPNVYFDASKNWTGATASAGSHTHTIGSTGSALPVNIMPPYQTVYMWRRTA